MGQTRVDLMHLLEDLRDPYPGPLQETIVCETVANALDSGVCRIALAADAPAATLTISDDGAGMTRAQLRRYHDLAATPKRRGHGIGFAGVKRGWDWLGVAPATPEDHGSDLKRRASRRPSRSTRPTSYGPERAAPRTSPTGR